jgi:cytochrome o ubiquinol oxidase subunit 1
MLGKLSWNAIPFGQPIPMAASLMIVVGMLAILSLIT